MPVMTEGVYSPASQDEKDAMYESLKRLDPEQEGVTLNKLRIFYPKTAWGEILVTLRDLKADGRAKNSKSPTQKGSTRQFEHWTWV